MNRRGFLGSILALAAAPAIVRAESLMTVRPIQIATFEQTIRVVQQYTINNDSIPSRLDLLYRLEDLEGRVINPAISKIAEKLDDDLLLMVRQNSVQITNKILDRWSVQ